MNGCKRGLRLKHVFPGFQGFSRTRYYNTNSMSSNNKGKTAAILVIGDEILKGQTPETNSHLICKSLYNRGVKVKRVIVIPDDVGEIAEHVSRLSSSYDYVLTSGGVGPTHDDLTYLGIAKAFNRKLTRHPLLVSLITKYFGDDDKHPALKMAEVPENAEVLLTTDKPGRFPLVTVDNVYILPGIPSFMERSFKCFLDKLETEVSCGAPNMEIIYVTLDEVSITESLNKAVKQFESRVVFGSYPTDTNLYYNVRITMESENKEDLIDARQYILKSFPAGSITDYDPNPVNEASAKLYKVLDSAEASELSFLASLRASVDLLTECLTSRYQPSDICISFNGGKDCTALLHLYFAVLNKLYPNYEAQITVLYIRCESPFPEVENFISESAERYKLKLCAINGSLKNGLEEFITQNPHIKAVLMGNRSTDPYSTNLKSYQMTDPGWPSLMRIFPILDWNYKDLWRFIRHFQLLYCNLYNKGYTSLGSTTNTKQNPNLRWVDGLGNIRYRPAYKLDDDNSERSGRL